MKIIIECDPSEIAKMTAVAGEPVEKKTESAVGEQTQQEFVLAKDKAQISIVKLIDFQCQKLYEYCKSNIYDDGYNSTLVAISRSIANLVDSLQKLGLQNQLAEEKIDTKRIAEIVEKN